MMRSRISRMRWLGAASLVVLAVALTACGSSGTSGSASSRATPTTTGTASRCPDDAAPARGIAYASVSGIAPRFLSLDVYPPPGGCPAPVVVWVHGGGWRAGDKSQQMPDKVRLAAEQGWVLVSVNYRLTDVPAAGDVGYPAHNEDVAAAIAWVHENIADYGGDPERIGLLGHSAGAQIVSSVGTDERYLAAHGLALSDVGCVGALDTEGYDVARRAGAGIPAYRAAFGDDPAVWADASPMTHVATGKDIPSFLVVERGGPPRRYGQQSFIAALRGAGVDVTVLDAGSLTHGEVNARIGAPGDDVMTAPLTDFLSGCFAAP